MQTRLANPVPGRFMVYAVLAEGEAVYLGTVWRNNDATTKAGRWLGRTYVETVVHPVNGPTRQACVDAICRHHDPSLVGPL